VATGVYTACWTAPQKAGVHSNQYFHCQCSELRSIVPAVCLGKAAHDLADLASKGEIRIDQAKRGYDVAADAEGQLMWYNPFYMKYAPDEEGNFNGQTAYGCISFEKFVDAVTDFKEGRVTIDELDKRGLPTLRNTMATTAILEAGRRSLDFQKSNGATRLTQGEAEYEPLRKIIRTIK